MTLCDSMIFSKYSPKWNWFYKIIMDFIALFKKEERICCKFNRLIQEQWCSFVWCNKFSLDLATLHTPWFLGLLTFIIHTQIRCLASRLIESATYSSCNGPFDKCNIIKVMTRLNTGVAIYILLNIFSDCGWIYVLKEKNQKVPNLSLFKTSYLRNKKMMTSVVW